MAPSNNQPGQCRRSGLLSRSSSQQVPRPCRHAKRMDVRSSISLRHTPDMVVLDAEVSNSTFAATFGKAYPERFFEMFIAEQNMVSAALGLSTRGRIPFVSTFAAFFSRAFDQVRMAQYAMDRANIKFTGSHVGVAIGPDGPSQMGLEDIAMFRTLVDSVVLYPCRRHRDSSAGPADGRPSRHLLPADHPSGPATPLRSRERSSPSAAARPSATADDDRVTLVGAGITLHEALKAADTLAAAGIHARVDRSLQHQAARPGDAAQGSSRDRGHHHGRGPLRRGRHR